MVWKKQYQSKKLFYQTHPGLLCNLLFFPRQASKVAGGSGWVLFFMENHNKSWYAVITADILFDKRLSDKQKLLVAVISNLSNEKGYCFASNAYLAQMLDCDKLTISRNISTLEEFGYINRVLILESTGDVKIRCLTVVHSGKMADSKIVTDCEFESDDNTHIHKNQGGVDNSDGVLTKMSRGIDENVKGGIDENVKYNNKENNNKLNMFKGADKKSANPKNNESENTEQPMPERGGRKIPTLEEFLANAKEVLGAKFPEYKFSSEAKYQAWKDAGWKDGFGKPIKNWKSKFNSTVPHLKPFSSESSQTITSGIKKI